MKYSLVQLGQILRARARVQMPFVYPAREWTIGVLCGVLILVAGIAHAVVVFERASTETEARAALQNDPVVLPYRAREVREVLEAYEGRARVFKDMRGTLLPPLPPEGEASGGTPDASEDATPVAE